ncbi:MAG: DNA adenine methylase [Anaerolineae bacterium]|nr:DNA adenine methylase [Anaerolineae bacterium]MCO5194708.1 DNA adenine methylase [Anaerolineae bacterium]MCO5204870.1 DNA adenine methylase [Anaerolineae bacterium]
MTNNQTSYKMINSPFKWVGGKSRLRKYIIPLIPKHTCYVEPFAGAAWVLFGKPPSQVEVINDIDQELITFFRVLKEKPEELVDSFEWELVSRAEFDRLALLNPGELTDIQRAHRFYYLIMAGWGGELNYPRFATSITDGGHGNRLFGALKNLRKRITPVYDRLRTVIIENLDWETCISRYDSQTTVLYVDPPYPKNGVNYKHNMRSWEEHEKLRDCLSSTQAKWLISSYDNEDVRELYKGYNIIPIRSYSGMATRKSNDKRVLNREILVLNFDPETGTLAKDSPSVDYQQKSTFQYKLFESDD